MEPKTIDEGQGVVEEKSLMADMGRVSEETKGIVQGSEDTAPFRNTH